MHEHIFPLQHVAGHASPLGSTPSPQGDPSGAGCPPGALTPSNMTQFHLVPAAKTGSMTGDGMLQLCFAGLVDFCQRRQPACWLL